ncbi:hypothetical protein [Ekhidna sp.]|jgi:hypothetical protein|uniref:hypothetical protein n=1 Tax=Ekhidna sp. TaxID=2608089 RepID=UPI003C7AD88C
MENKLSLEGINDGYVLAKSGKRPDLVNLIIEAGESGKLTPYLQSLVVGIDVKLKEDQALQKGLELHREANQEIKKTSLDSMKEKLEEARRNDSSENYNNESSRDIDTENDKTKNKGLGL